MVKKEKLKQIGHVLGKCDGKEKIKRGRKKCPVCGIEVHAELEFCPNCDYVF